MLRKLPSVDALLKTDQARSLIETYSREAVVVATESRTSAPVRIPRDPHTFMHPELEGLYPCGEGAGYAGGIISAAMDGQNVAKACAEKLRAASAP